DGQCEVDNSTRPLLLEKCNEMALMANGSITGEELDTMMNDCMFDLCSVYTNTSGNPEALQEYMGDIMNSTEEIMDNAVKTTDADPLPPPLPAPARSTRLPKWTTSTTLTEHLVTAYSTYDDYLTTTEVLLPPSQQPAPPETKPKPSGTSKILT
ncbi:hypothetical protein SK128_016619, partial [Halocaridina rubra]